MKKGKQVSPKVIERPKRSGRESIFSDKDVEAVHKLLESADENQAVSVAEGLKTSTLARSRVGSFVRSYEKAHDGVRLRTHVMESKDGFTAAVSIKTQ